MQNFIFISPNFPTNYWQFCRELKNDGMNVLGIGDQPYDELKPELKDSLNEYYKVGSLENYDEVYRAVAFFIFKYGRIDWLESNNEYWLERDAALRTDFHITSGFQTEDMPRIKYKSKMKEYYQKAGIATARYHMVDDLNGCKAFIKQVREDGKIDLILQKPGFEKVDDFSKTLLQYIKDNGGRISLNDKSPADEIYSTFGVSKKTFKKGVGDLYKKHLIILQGDGILLAKPLNS